MKKEVRLGNRILFLECEELKACKTYDSLLDFILKNEGEFEKMMDDYEIPENIVLNFKPGSGDLAGIYHEQHENVKKHVIVIDIYTKHLGEEYLVELIDTFIHEIVHHKIKSDKEVNRITRNIVKGLNL
jgi:hypothetical protein